MRQRRDARLQDLERGVVVMVELRQLEFRQVLFIEVREREVEFLAKFRRGENRFAVNLEYLVARLQHRSEIIHERAGPIENDVTNCSHFQTVAAVYNRRTLNPLKVVAVARWAAGSGRTRSEN